MNYQEALKVVEKYEKLEKELINIEYQISELNPFFIQEGDTGFTSTKFELCRVFNNHTDYEMRKTNYTVPEELKTIIRNWTEEKLSHLETLREEKEKELQAFEES